MISGCALAVEVAGNRAPDTPFTFDVVGTDGGFLLAGGHPHGFQAGRLALSLNGQRSTRRRTARHAAGRCCQCGGDV